MDHDHFVSAAALVWNHRGQVLMIDSPLRGWEYPGGMIEAGETIQDGLRREIYEETGVTAEITGFVGVSKNLGRDIVNLDFTARYVSGDLTPSPESKSVRWMDPEEALAAVTLPVTRKRLRNMLSGRPDVPVFGFYREPYREVQDEAFPMGGPE